MLLSPSQAKVQVLAEAPRTSEFILVASISQTADFVQAEPFCTIGQVCSIRCRRFIEATPYDCRRQDNEATTPSVPHPDRPRHWLGRVFCLQSEGDREGQGRSGMQFRSMAVIVAKDGSHIKSSLTSSSLPRNQS